MIGNALVLNLPVINSGVILWRDFSQMYVWIMVPTPFCILNRHLFIRLRLVAVDFVTLALVLNRGSWF